MKVLQFCMLVVSTLAFVIEANDIVYTLSGYGQLVTSSTLRWITTHADEKFARVDRHVIRAHGDDGGSAICRGYYQNTLVPGGTTTLNQCAAYFFEKLVLLEDFQVLVNSDLLTSRYEWEKWDIFTKLPIGVVAFTEGVAEATYIAKSNAGKICELNPYRGLSGNLAVTSQDGKTVAFFGKRLHPQRNRAFVLSIDAAEIRHLASQSEQDSSTLRQCTIEQ